MRYHNNNEKKKKKKKRKKKKKKEKQWQNMRNKNMDSSDKLHLCKIKVNKCTDIDWLKVQQCCGSRVHGVRSTKDAKY